MSMLRFNAEGKIVEKRAKYNMLKVLAMMGIKEAVDLEKRMDEHLANLIKEKRKAIGNSNRE